MPVGGVTICPALWLPSLPHGSGLYPQNARQDVRYLITEMSKATKTEANRREAREIKKRYEDSETTERVRDVGGFGEKPATITP